MEGPASDIVTVVIVDKPVAPVLIEKEMTYSSKTSLGIKWSAVTVPAAQSPGGDILGYVLHATNPLTGETWEAFNGVKLGLRAQTSASVLGLTTGAVYHFQVVAHNFNGPGTFSAVFDYRACVLPSQFMAPIRAPSPPA